MHTLPVRKRLQRLTAEWPDVLSLPLQDYLRKWQRKTNPRAGGVPYWILLPAWLFRSYRRTGIAMDVGRSFLEDILWGQWCLFLCIRIQDDLFDGQADSQALLFISDQFLMEAERTFARHFSQSSGFWKVEYHCMAATTEAIVTADNLQRSPAARPQTLLSCYARTAEVFKVGSAAVCTTAGRARDFRHISSFADHVAVVSQIADDCDDVVEDLERGRYNFVTSLLMKAGNVTPSRGRKVISNLARSYLYTNVPPSLFRIIHRHIDGAASAIAPLKIPELPRHIESYRDFFKAMEMKMHRARVRQFEIRLNARKPRRAQVGS